MVAQTANGKLNNRRALEALRNGVPNGDAVAVLGCNQPWVERLFNEMLSEVTGEGQGTEGAQGMLVAGEFGSGKSHLLGYLELQALSQNFVCSRVVISKETPLFDVDKIYRAVVENAKVPGVTGQMVEEIAQKLDPNSHSYGEFFRWANRNDNGLHRILPATLMVHERDNDPELLNRINWFWSGERIDLKPVRDGLRHVGQLQNYPFRAPVSRDMPPQKLRFVLGLIKAAGYRGWVILLDEIELVANYSVLQRARSYAEIARWMGQTAEEKYPGLVVVGTMTTDLPVVVLDDKEDRDKAVPRLRARGGEADLLTAVRAEAGIRLLEHGVRNLAEPDGDMLLSLYGQLRTIHSEAYDWDAPHINHDIGSGIPSRIRSYVRRWINEWDLRRLYPDTEPDIEETELTFSYEEDTTLEQAHSEDDGSRTARE